MTFLGMYYVVVRICSSYNFFEAKLGTYDVTSHGVIYTQEVQQHLKFLLKKIKKIKIIIKVDNTNLGTNLKIDLKVYNNMRKF